MKHRSVRIVLAVAVILASFAAGYHVFRAEREIARIAGAARQFDQAAQHVLEQAANLKAGERAYVAPGQGLSFWTQRNSLTLASIQAGLATLHGSATMQEAKSALESAQAASGRLAVMDQRMQKALHIGDQLMAADTIFSEGEQASANLTRQMTLARTRQLADSRSQVSVLQRRQAILAGSAALLLILALLALVPVDDARQAVSEPPLVLISSADAEQADGSATTGFGELRLAAEPPDEASPAAPDVDFEAAAALCADIARLDSPIGLPMLLERAAGLLDASGVVIWAASGGGTDLIAALSHGYPAQAVARMPTIATDANNVTAVAFRTGRLQYATGDMVTRGALAAPLLSPGGSVGVFTAEMRNTGELLPARRALASIIASQLATVVGAVPPGAAADLAQSR